MTDSRKSFPDPERGHFQVRLHPKVRKIDLEELRLDESTMDQYSKAMLRLLFCFINVLRHLGYWPPSGDDTDAFSFAADFQVRSVEHNSCSFFQCELPKEDLHRIDKGFESKRGLRFFFWIDNDQHTIWVLRVRWARGNHPPKRELTRVVRRLHALKAANQDLRTDE